MECKTCNQQFIVTKDRTTFCCPLCQKKWAIKIASQFRKPKPLRGVTLNCFVCKKEFYVAQHRIKKAKYCSRSCLAKDKLPQYGPIYGFKKTGKPHHVYRYITVNGKKIREHRHIMQEYLGRKLESWEHVHHINDDSSDNRIENLRVLSNSDHQRIEYQLRKNLTSS